jgi:hypothetical protein
MTRLRRCGTEWGLAEDFNKHILEVLGITMPGLGFVAGGVDAAEGCDRPTSMR